MKYPKLSHQELKKDHDYNTTMEFFLPERENPVAILQYELVIKRVIVGIFFTINGIGRMDLNNGLVDYVATRIGKSDFGKGLYPGIGIECLRLFIKNIASRNSSIATLELQSALSAVGFYRKAASRLLESGDIIGWKQGDGAQITRNMPVILVRYLDYFPQFSNPMKFKLQLQK